MKEHEKAGRGFLNNSICFLLMVILIVSSALGNYVVPLFVIFVFGVDWIVYRTRRGRRLARWEKSDLRVDRRDLAPLLNKLFGVGQRAPTMENLASTSGAKRDEFQIWAEGERYRICCREYELVEKEVGTVADVGTGSGILYHKYGLGKGKRFLGVDVVSDLLQQFREKCDQVYLIQADGHELPFPDNCIDLIACTESLEHCHFPGKALAEFGRSLKVNGHVILTVPNATRLRNLNPFHILVTGILGLFFDKVLQKTTVHASLHTTMVTPHYDFSLRDLRGLGSKGNLTILKSYSDVDVNFCRTFLKRKILYETIRKILRNLPIIKYWGRNLVVIFGKAEVAS